MTMQIPTRVPMLALLFLLGTTLLAGAAAAADRPLGVVDSQRIADEYDAARDAQEQYQKFLRELELEVADKEKSLTQLAEEIESQKMLLGEEALATKVQQFEQQRAEYFQFRETIDQRAETEYTAKITPILDQVKTIVDRIGKERGFGLIVDSAAMTVLYLDADFDLTDEVLSALARGGE
ncbi:MAG: OmpH family outer membrane protein [bacterium]|nr:OmpH family outer membrane protein [bacterium]